MIRRLIVGAVLACSLPSFAQSDEAEAAFVAGRRQVTLQEALNLAAKNNPDLRAARAAADQVAAKAGLVYSAVLPQISLSLSGVLTSAPAVIDNGAQTDLLGALVQASAIPPPQRDAILGGLSSAPRTIAIQARESLFGTLLVQQVLFAPEFFLLPAAGEAKEAARLGSLEAREQILLQVAKLYLGLEGLEQIEKAARDAETVSLKREKDAKAQVAVGTNTDIALLRAQTETASARSTLASLQGNRVALLAMLEALTGEPVRPMENAPSHFEVTPGTEADAPWEKLYAVKSSLVALQSQERFNTFDRLSWLPSVVIQGKGNYNSNRGFVNTNWTADGILAMQWNLYDRGVRYANLHENDAKTVQLRSQLEGTRTRARATWLGGKSNLVAAQSALTQAEAQAQLATRAQKQIESAFQVGLATSLEVSDIDSKRFFAESAAAQARANLEIKKVELAAAEGRLAQVLGLAE